MKLSKRDAEKIVNLYGLGKLIHFKLNPGGAVNYNFDFKTSSGEYIVKLLSCKLNDSNKKKLEFEFKFLEFLEKSKFPYDFPNPIKSKDGRVLLNLGSSFLWVYRKIPGEVIYNFNKINEIAKVLSKFHSISKKFKVPKNLKYTYADDLIIKYLKIKARISKISNPSRVDKLVISNYNMFESALYKIKEMNYTENLIITHSDFGNHNLLFENGKVKAILDFENLSLNPRVKEVAYAIKRLCFADNKLDKRKMNLFLKEYEKTIKLTNKEKEFILPMMILDSCNVFYWVYMEMKKNPAKRYFFLNKCINTTKYLVNEMKL